MRADAERNRHRLLDAAVEMILEVGGEPARDGIARRAGVGIGTLYRHFPDQQALLGAVAMYVLDAALAAAETALADAPDGMEALRRYAHAAVDEGLGALQIVYPLLDDVQWPDERRRAEELLEAIVTRARSEGLIRTDASATDIVFAIIRFCRPLGVGLPLSEERSIAHRHIDAYIDGLAKSRSTSDRRDHENLRMPIEHIGLGVPDVDAAKAWFDAFMPMVGFQPCFGNGYCPEDFQGAQLFLYESLEPQDYSRHGVGLQHLAFLVSSRAEVHRIHEWADGQGAEIVRAPKAYPEYGPDCYATYFLDPHGFMIEVVTHEQVGSE